jgi:hypothetical protein
MAMQIGKVRFADGTLLYVVVQGTSGYASTRLYVSSAEAAEHRDDERESLYPPVPEQIHDNEFVDVWTREGSEDAEPSFYSTASRSLMLLTGERSRESAGAEYMREQMSWGFGSR